MPYDTVYTRQWVTGTTATRVLQHRIPRTIFGWNCGKRTFTRTIAPRSFDTRNGDPFPRHHLKECIACFKGTFLLTRVYIYPGEEVEIPTFDHATGRRPLRSTQTLMASIVPAGVYAVALPLYQVATVFDSTIVEPYVEIAYYTKHGFFVFDGPQGFEVKLHFRDVPQQREYCFEFAPPTEVNEDIAA